jgi:crotonobetainyl-CoA:carnitine CoA-transferase CaiB-like acyl-CoA transferase
MSPLLDDVRVLEIGGRGAAVCGLLFAQLGADVIAVPAPDRRPRTDDIALQANKQVIDAGSGAAGAAVQELLAGADVCVLDGPPRWLQDRGLDPGALRDRYPSLVVASITPFGLTGPRRYWKGGDLVAFNSSGIARLLVGHVDDPESEPPMRASGEQSDFITGLTAACAVMHALFARQCAGDGQLIDVSAQEAMALMAARELAMPALGGQPAPRAGHARGGSAVIPTLPAADGYVAISPREPHQWQQWLEVIGRPAWAADPRFATRAARTANYPALHHLMSEWTRKRSKAEIFKLCQAAHVPCFPFGRPSDMLEEPQLLHRRFFAPLQGDGRSLMVPRPPFGLPQSDYVAAPELPAAAGGWRAPVTAAKRNGAKESRDLPLAGVRVLDFSWVIAGPTCTRYLALMGADVIKVEAPGRPDTGRASELHDVLGQSKRAICIDLKAPGALAAVRRLVASSDVVVENFATGVMERLGLGYAELRRIKSDIVLLSASGLGRTGPGAEWVAYGNLLSAYSGFAELNGLPGHEPRTGLAWADPLCGLLMAFAVVAALRDRERGGGGRHIDFSMLEGLLWTMPAALLAPQLTGADLEPAGNDDSLLFPHGLYRTAGDDRWLAIAVTSDDEWAALCSLVPGLSASRQMSQEGRRGAGAMIDGILRDWTAGRDAIEAAEALQATGVPAFASYTTNDMFGDGHLWERGFYREVAVEGEAPRFLPGLPWRWGDGSAIEPGAAPGVGQHTELVLREVAGLSEPDIESLRSAGAFGREGGHR